MIKLYDYVQTPDGPGKVVDFDFYKLAKRYGIVITGHEIKYYYEKEIKPL